MTIKNSEEMCRWLFYEASKRQSDMRLLARLAFAALELSKTVLDIWWYLTRWPITVWPVCWGTSRRWTGVVDQRHEMLGMVQRSNPFPCNNSPKKSLVFISPSMIKAPCGPNFRLGEMLVLDHFEYWKSSRHLKATIFGAMRKWCIMNTNPERYRYCFFSNFSLTNEWIQLWAFHYLQV